MLRVFEISRMTNMNGPGIRTLVHFKGCPLRCIWCSTPESQQTDFELQYKAMRCICCGACVEVCPEHVIVPLNDPDKKMLIHRERCSRCFRCVDECYSTAMNKVGRDWGVDELFNEIIKDEVFFRKSGGGVTFSGGEPLMHVDEDMVELYRKLHDHGISIGVDTTGYVPWDTIEKLLPYIQFFLWDLKVMDPAKHKTFTGAGNELILDNLKKVESLYDTYGTKVYIRCVQVPGMTDYDDNLRETCRFLEGMKCIEEINILNFHHHGQMRYEAVGRPYFVKDLKPLTDEVMSEKKAIVESMGFRCRVNN